MGLGFGYSIYFMLSLVFALFGTIVFVVARIIVREERQRAAREAARKAVEAPPSPPVGA